MDIKDIKKDLLKWMLAEEMAGRTIDDAQANEWLQARILRHNSSPCEEFNGLSPQEMYIVLYYPFSSQCAVKLNKLSKEQYELIPLIRQALFLLNTLGESELKLTKLGWLPLKIVAEAYRLGRPVYIIEEFQQKRINEYEVKSLCLARDIIELLRWVKTRKGMLSLTAKGRKAMEDIDAAANEILRFSLVGIGVDSFDGYENDTIGNFGTAYSVWLLNKFGAKWRSGKFYQEHYQKIVPDDDPNNIYALRIFSRLFYWLGIVDIRKNDKAIYPIRGEYRKTELLSMIFSFG